MNKYFAGNVDRRHEALWSHLQRIQKEQDTRNRITRLSKKQYLGEADEFGVLKHTSAAQAREFPKILSQLLSDTEREDHLQAALDAAKEMEEVIQTQGVFPSHEAATRLCDLFHQFVLHYNWLTSESIELAVLLFNQTPKLHMMFHTCELAIFCNPRILWTYRWETLMSKMIQSASRACAGTPTERVGNKVMENYMTVLLLMLNRMRQRRL